MTDKDKEAWEDLEFEEPNSGDLHEDSKEMLRDFHDLVGDFMDLAEGVARTARGEDPDEVEAEIAQDNIGVWLVGIEYHWEGSEISNSAIPLQPVDTGWLPESRSKVAYSITDTAAAVKDDALTLQARFYCDGGKRKIQVRTQNVEISVGDLFSGATQASYSSENALGEVPPSTVFIGSSGFSVFRGKYTYVPLKLQKVRFQELGVGIYDINWRWQFRFQDEEASKAQGKTVWEEEWRRVRTMPNRMPIHLTRPFQLTKHRVFLVLDEPVRPWSSCLSYDYSLGIPFPLPVWAYGLNWACEWARGAHTKAEAAKMITDRFYESGRFTYDPNPNYSHLTSGGKKDYRGKVIKARKETPIAYLKLIKVLERLNGGEGYGPEVNCLDCALTIVALANMIGCRLLIGKLQNQADIDSTDASHYEDNYFEINPVCAIGLDGAKEEEIRGVSYEDKSYFAYHTVAWSAPDDNHLGIADDFTMATCTIYDASLKFDIDGKKVSAAGLKLGDGKTEGTYINLLAADTSEGRPRCNPQPITVFEIQITG